MKKFNLMHTWNSLIEKPRDRPLEKRDRIYASEIGGSMIDIWLKMRATPQTNPPNERSRRKFLAGNIWEWIMQMVLVTAGVKFTQQDKVLLEYDGLLPISGKIDFIVSGHNDWDEVLENIEKQKMMLPDFMIDIAKKIVEDFRDEGFEEKIIEIKSISSFMYEKVENQNNAQTHHMYQAFCYKKYKGLPTDVIYINRDDVRMLQYNIDEIADDLENEVLSFLRVMTTFHQQNIQPPKEKLVLWDDVKKKFEKNWKVEYSSYLSLLYTYKDENGIEKPFEQPDEYYDWASSKASAWNRVVKRVKDNESMTKSNMEYIDEMKKEGYDLVELLKA